MSNTVLGPIFKSTLTHDQGNNPFHYKRKKLFTGLSFPSAQNINWQQDLKPVFFIQHFPFIYVCFMQFKVKCALKHWSKENVGT